MAEPGLRYIVSPRADAPDNIKRFERCLVEVREVFTARLAMASPDTDIPTRLVEWPVSVPAENRVPNPGQPCPPFFFDELLPAVDHKTSD